MINEHKEFELNKNKQKDQSLEFEQPFGHESVSINNGDSGQQVEVVVVDRMSEQHR